MKIGVIGTGKMGRIHCRVLRELGFLCGVYDKDQITCHAVAKDFGTFPHTDLDGIVHNTSLDGVVIATPTPYHLDSAMKCLDAGHNILLEKPMCLTIAEAQRLVAKSKISKGILTVGYIERYNPVFRELRSRAKTGLFGDITSVNIKRVGGIPRSADNVVMDIMTHDINLLLTLFEREPENVYVHKREEGNIVHSAQALLDFGRASATCEANWVSPTKMRTIAITGTSGYIEADMIKQEITQRSESSTHVDIYNEEPLKNEILAFANAIEKSDTSGIVTVDEAFQTLKITTEAAYGAKNE